MGNNLRMRQFQDVIENAINSLGLTPGEAYYILMYEAVSIEKIFDQLVQREYQDPSTTVPKVEVTVENTEEPAGQE